MVGGATGRGELELEMLEGRRGAGNLDFCLAAISLHIYHSLKNWPKSSYSIFLLRTLADALLLVYYEIASIG